jgi:tetratricopeptide (TPR) repeat protein
MRIAAITSFLLLLSSISSAQNISFAEWEQESKSNKRLLPQYGHLPKSEQEISADTSYINKIMSMPQFSSRRQASDHMIGLGFQYYYKPDLKTAMYRFNQAYLLDSTNTDIFWGYGAIYMALGNFGIAKEQYEAGLKINPSNPHLLTDMGTWFMQQFHVIKEMPKNDIVKNPEEEARKSMDSAIAYLKRSYADDSKDVNTVFKLSVCYWELNDCANAWKYYDACMNLGGRPITEEYTKDLKRRCKRN